ncbi:alpha/beta fold hydrolase [Streptacidiphilus fuscans]|uniref:Alpha/beta hydrolase n=1 Tax=Streptacidiphilus fuscans TaxID=2789292 RepID=A0A931AZK6_9ACTN|nr:alpha/beta hydrolase [Streptacidiphilus fuscans]MBF9067468.1 alpha/beta hydrolase [Streptacidiphilus fuscans]
MTETPLSSATSDASPRTAVDTHSFDSGDGDLVYRDSGPRDGQLVVLLHTGFVDRTQYDNLVPGLAAQGYRVVVPDARGHGDSANASRPFRFTDDLAALLRHLDAVPAVLVGVSMGAMIASDTALEHPELVRALVMSGYGLGDHDADDPWFAERAAAQNDALWRGDIPAWLDVFLDWIPGPDRALADIDPEIPRQVREMAIRTLMKHTPDEPDHAVPVTGKEQRARELTVPVLAVNGAFDCAGVLRSVARTVAAVPDARAVDLADAGHYTTMERPEEFTRILVDFLRTLA